MSYPPWILTLQGQYKKKKKTTWEALPATVKHHVLSAYADAKRHGRDEGNGVGGSIRWAGPSFEGVERHCR